MTNKLEAANKIRGHLEDLKWYSRQIGKMRAEHDNLIRDPYQKELTACEDDIEEQLKLLSDGD